MRILIVGSDSKHITDNVVPELAPIGVFMLEHWDWSHPMDQPIPEGVQAIILISRDLSKEKTSDLQKLAAKDGIRIIKSSRKPSLIVRNIQSAGLGQEPGEDVIFNAAFAAYRLNRGEKMGTIVQRVCDAQAVNNKKLREFVSSFIAMVAALEEIPELSSEQLTGLRAPGLPVLSGERIAARARTAMQAYWQLNHKLKLKDEHKSVRQAKTAWVERTMRTHMLDHGGEIPTNLVCQDAAREVFGYGISANLLSKARQQMVSEGGHTRKTAPPRKPTRVVSPNKPKDIEKHLRHQLAQFRGKLGGKSRRIKALEAELEESRRREVIDQVESNADTLEAQQEQELIRDVDDALREAELLGAQKAAEKAAREAAVLRDQVTELERQNDELRIQVLSQDHLIQSMGDPDAGSPCTHEGELTLSDLVRMGCSFTVEQNGSS